MLEYKPRLIERRDCPPEQENQGKVKPEIDAKLGLAHLGIVSR